MKTLWSITVALALLSPAISAQSRPEFSGTWIPDPEKTRASSPGSMTAGQAGGGGGGMRGGGGSSSGGGISAGGGIRAGGGSGGTIELGITQTKTALTIERVLGERVQKYVHTFDGQENVNVNGRITSRTRSKWDGARLVTEGTQVFASDQGDMVVNIREVRSLGPDGTMTVESDRTADGNTSASAQVYRKK